VVLGRPADELEMHTVLLVDHAAAVVLLFVDPPVAVKRLPDFGGLHEDDLREAAHLPSLRGRGSLRRAGCASVKLGNPLWEQPSPDK